jgi:hypothetical protein
VETFLIFIIVRDSEYYVDFYVVRFTLCYCTYIFYFNLYVTIFLIKISSFVFGSSSCQPLGKGLLQRLLLNLCAHSLTRATLIYLLLDMIKPEVEGSVIRPVSLNSQRLYGCHSNTVYGRSQLVDGNCLHLMQNIIFIYLSQYYSLFHADLSFHFFIHSRSSSPSVPPNS